LGLLTNLPAQLSSFIGREVELAAARPGGRVAAGRKLGLSSRAAAAAWGVRSGLV
jgi:hypothetical protein